MTWAASAAWSTDSSARKGVARGTETPLAHGREGWPLAADMAVCQGGNWRGGSEVGVCDGSSAFVLEEKKSNDDGRLR